MTFRCTLDLISSDMRRYAAVNGIRLTFRRKISVMLIPPVTVLILYRLSRYFHAKGHNGLARLFWTLNIIVFAADIAPVCDIGPSFYLPHPTSVLIRARIGANCTVFALGSVGGRQDRDIGAGRGIPILGDNVTVGAGAMILGTVRIGDGVVIAPRATVFRSLPAGATYFGLPGRAMRGGRSGINFNSKMEGASK